MKWNKNDIIVISRYDGQFVADRHSAHDKGDYINYHGKLSPAGVWCGINDQQGQFETLVEVMEAITKAEGVG